MNPTTPTSPELGQPAPDKGVAPIVPEKRGLPAPIKKITDNARAFFKIGRPLEGIQAVAEPTPVTQTPISETPALPIIKESHFTMISSPEDIAKAGLVRDAREELRQQGIVGEIGMEDKARQLVAKRQVAPTPEAVSAITDQHALAELVREDPKGAEQVNDADVASELARLRASEQSLAQSITTGEKVLLPDTQIDAMQSAIINEATAKRAPDVLPVDASSPIDSALQAAQDLREPQSIRPVTPVGPTTFVEPIALSSGEKDTPQATPLSTDTDSQIIPGVEPLVLDENDLPILTSPIPQGPDITSIRNANDALFKDEPPEPSPLAIPATDIDPDPSDPPLPAGMTSGVRASQPVAPPPPPLLSELEVKTALGEPLRGALSTADRGVDRVRDALDQGVAAIQTPLAEPLDMSGIQTPTPDLLDGTPQDFQSGIEAPADKIANPNQLISAEDQKRITDRNTYDTYKKEQSRLAQEQSTAIKANNEPVSLEEFRMLNAQAKAEQADSFIAEHPYVARQYANIDADLTAALQRADEKRKQDEAAKQPTVSTGTPTPDAVIRHYGPLMRRLQENPTPLPTQEPDTSWRGEPVDRSIISPFEQSQLDQKDLQDNLKKPGVLGRIFGSRKSAPQTQYPPLPPLPDLSLNREPQSAEDISKEVWGRFESRRDAIQNRDISVRPELLLQAAKELVNKNRSVAEEHENDSPFVATALAEKRIEEASARSAREAGNAAQKVASEALLAREQAEVAARRSVDPEAARLTAVDQAEAYARQKRREAGEQVAEPLQVSTDYVTYEVTRQMYETPEFQAIRKQLLEGKYHNRNLDDGNPVNDRLKAQLNKDSEDLFKIQQTQKLAELTRQAQRPQASIFEDIAFKRIKSELAVADLYGRPQLSENATPDESMVTSDEVVDTFIRSCPEKAALYAEKDPVVRALLDDALTNMPLEEFDNEIAQNFVKKVRGLNTATPQVHAATSPTSGEDVVLQRQDIGDVTDRKDTQKSGRAYGRYGRYRPQQPSRTTAPIRLAQQVILGGEASMPTTEQHSSTPQQEVTASRPEAIQEKQQIFSVIDASTLITDAVKERLKQQVEKEYADKDPEKIKFTLADILGMILGETAHGLFVGGAKLATNAAVPGQ